MTMGKKQNNSGAEDHVGKNVLEWTVFGLSSLLVVGLVGWLIYAATLEEDPEVRLSAKAEDPVEANGWYQVSVVVTNDGGLTAEGVEVIVSATVDGREQTGSFVVDFVPKGGSRRGAVSFKGSGKPSQVVPRVIGFSES